MKLCTHCWEMKDESEFNWRHEGVSRWGICRECQRQQKIDWYQEHHEEHLRMKKEYNQNRRDARRQFVLDYLSTHPCVECGESDPVVLEFDHLRDKDKAIGEMISAAATFEDLESEMAKCQVLCANCHRRRHAQEKGWFRFKH